LFAKGMVLLISSLSGRYALADGVNDAGRAGDFGGRM